MAKHEWTIFCSQVLTNEHGQLAILNLIDAIGVNGKGDANARIVLPGDYVVFSMWTRSDPKVGEHVHARESLYAPSDEMLLRHEYEFSLEEVRRGRNQSKFVGIPIRGTGVHRWVTELITETKTPGAIGNLGTKRNFTVVAETAFDVEVIVPPAILARA